MDNQIIRQQRVQLDLKELMWRLLSQWKAIILFSVIVAILLCGTKYHKDMQSYKVAKEALTKSSGQATLSQTEQINSILSSLSEEEKNAVYYVVSQKEWLNYEKEYTQKSIFMKTDPTNQRVLKMLFDIEGENKADLVVLLQFYYNYLQSEEMIDELKPFFDDKADSNSIRELYFRFDKENEIIGNKGLLEVNIAIPEDMDAAAVADTINKELTSQTGLITKKYPHSISEASREVVHIFSQDNLEKRQQMYNNINSLESAIKSAEGSLSEAQKKAVSLLIEMHSENNNRKDLQEESGEKYEENSASNSEAYAAPRLSKKYTLFGFVLGIFLYAFIYAAFMYLRNCINSALDAEELVTKRLLGEVYYDYGNNGIAALKHSKAIERLRYGEMTDAQNQIKKTVESIKAICELYCTKTIPLIRIGGASETSNAIIDEIAENLKEREIETRIIEANSSFSEGQLLNIKYAIPVIERGTKATLLGKMMGLCHDYNITIPGSVYIAEK